MEATAEAIAELIDNPAVAAAIAGRARRSAIDRFSTDRYSRDLCTRRTTAARTRDGKRRDQLNAVSEPAAIVLGRPRIAAEGLDTRKVGSGRMRTVRILGTHGVPAAYGGFETAAENIGLYLRDQGWRVIVYCQLPVTARRRSTSGTASSA